MHSQPSIPALFQVHPELKKALPWMRLGVLPTPLQHLDGLVESDLWVKRDDLSSPVYGGNKVRKLEFILAQVLQQGKTHIVTLGGLGTNHGLATAIYGRRIKLACTLVLFPQPVTPAVKQNLRLLKYFGARLIYRPSLTQAVFSYYLFQRVRCPGAYFLYAGGSNAVGTLGFVSAAFELKQQIDAGAMPAPAVIFCPVGSNGTLAGLTLGTRLAGLDCTVIGVRVSFSHCGPFQSCTPGTVRRLMSQCHRLLIKAMPDIETIDLPEPTMWHDYVGKGYGCPTARGQQALRLLKDKRQILLDSTYTAKTFAAVLDYCRNQQDISGPVLYWHTYNSVDLSREAQSVDDRELPPAVHPFLLANDVEI